MDGKSFWDTNAWRLIKTAIEILLIVAFIYGAIVLYTSLGFASAKAGPYDNITEGYILCDDFVYIRRHPNNKDEPLGRFETGDMVYLDGRKRNGYLHCIDLSLEMCEGWVSKRYIVYDKPIKVNQRATIVSKGRLAARKNVNGKRTRWLKPLASVMVYWWSDEWCVTDCGYLMTKYLELEGE